MYENMPSVNSSSLSIQTEDLIDGNYNRHVIVLIRTYNSNLIGT